MSRVTNNMMINNFNNNYNKNQANLNKYMNQLSTGKQFTKVSEDSLKATKALQLKTTIEFNERYTENIKDGNGWLAATDQALDDSINTLRKLRDLGVQGATGSITSEDAKQIQSEVDQLQDHLVNIGNTDYGGRYIFNGTRTLDKPYVNGGSNNPDDYYAEGDISDGTINREVSPGITVDINVAGSEVGNGGFEQIFADVQKLSNALGDNDKDAIAQAIDDLDAHIEDTLRVRSGVGARQNRLELMEDRLEAQKISNTDLLNETEGVDYAETIMKLQGEENIHRASLAVGAKLIQPTLIDFLR